ncbi:zymogen granule membrane protein 16-like, partial [Phascolarctos cinereus]|uniref:Zymogen granule membrane protein 16-like n=1 Tax=Phascolarctos cinereus TaxID=38626 RepID=A0A6P5JQM5_PHACI
MLLLFLTLVLLGASANGSQQSQDQSILQREEEGSNFVLSKEQKEINGVRIQVGLSGYLTSIQVRHGTEWSLRYGSPKGSLKEVVLSTDEFIVQVTGSNGNTRCLQQLTFVTNKGKKLEFGKVGPNQFTASSTDGGKALTSIFARYDSACLTGFAFHWIDVNIKKGEKKTAVKKQVSSQEGVQQQFSVKKGR